MEKFEHEEVMPDRGGEVTVGSAPQAKVVAIWVDDDSSVGSASAEMTPDEARKVAALLLKHADRAEGKS